MTTCHLTNRSKTNHTSRRELLQTCGAVAGSALVPLCAACGDDEPKQDEAARLVRFGHTDLYVTRYCQGTAFRQVSRSDNPAARAILNRCLDVGINFFDSAEAYGWGGSETVLGRVIRGRRDKVIICTKAAMSLKPARDPDTNQFKLGKPVAFQQDVLQRKLEGKP